jgi:hypothetical protein
VGQDKDRAYASARREEEGKVKLYSISGVGAKGHVWTVNLPSDSKVVSFGDRLLVASPMALMWLDGEGDWYQATSYPKTHQDDGV